MLTITLNGEIIENVASESKLDLVRFSGSWHLIASIPTSFDKHWRYAKDTYHVNKNGRIDIVTEYIEEGDDKRKTLKTKGFPIEKEGFFRWKIQFIWPFRVDYLIEELASDYSYVVIGHPKKRFLYIMSRTENMEQELLEGIVDRCRRKGYDPRKLKRMER
jgi:apolipoprotein D and lipocalin family protein